MFILPKLAFDYSALEPHIDAKTMEIHHTKHHQAYIDKLAAAVSGTPQEEMTVEELCKVAGTLPAAVRNNAGGHYNHSLFWTLLSPDGGEPTGALFEALLSSFGSLEAFKEAFAGAGAGQFGSGWAWLIHDGSKLVVGATPNQDNPLMDVASIKGTPLLALDVWEHAYYLHYQNRRPDYISAFWNVVNWQEVAKRYAAVTA